MLGLDYWLAFYRSYLLANFAANCCNCDKGWLKVTGIVTRDKSVVTIDFKTDNNLGLLLGSVGCGNCFLVV